MDAFELEYDFVHLGRKFLSSKILIVFDFVLQKKVGKP